MASIREPHREITMIRKIALIGAATLFSISLAAAQSSGPSSTAGGAQGTSKSGELEKPAGGMPSGNMKAAPKSTTGAGRSGESSPSSTAGGAQGTTKGGPNTPGAR
jgi:hypothetical protein